MPALLLAVLAALAPDVFPADQAQDHIGETATFRLTVQSSHNAAKRSTYYLDSEEDFHDDDNLSVVIAHEHADAFKKAGIDDPAVYYRNKLIEVTGQVIEEDDQVRIRVTAPDQIKLIEKDDPKTPA